MTKRKPLIAANWKMNPRPRVLESYMPHEKVDTIVFPTFFDLLPCLESGLITGAQYGHASDTGAHTGDISMMMLAEKGCQYVLCGHSERRQYHSETDAFIGQQAASALKHSIHPIICIGESEKERSKGESKAVVQHQLEIALGALAGADVTIAYEPVWAISGGDPTKPAASAKDAEDMHSFIRSLLPEDRREAMRILYGGSMKPENAEELLKQPDIDGGLVGGASLDPAAFRDIVAMAALL
jgi:triosephosphate isomerase (TIM)